jgi:ABC-2 type transport system permease protein
VTRATSGGAATADGARAAGGDATLAGRGVVHRVPAGQVFGALLMRDVRVVSRELPTFLLRTGLQPLLLTLVFGYLLPKMGFVRGAYTAALLPGILAVTMTLASLQAVALPMVTDFGWTGEIEDRLLAPVGIQMVALEKVVSGVLQGVLAALFVLPFARLIMGPIQGLTISNAWEVLLTVTLGAAAFSCFGLLLGTAFAPQQIGLMFGMIVAPMIFLGCAYYPWKGLDAVPVLKYLVLLNPLVYASEGLRGALTPSMPHMEWPFVTLALALISALFWTLGIRSFERRAVT